MAGSTIEISPQSEIKFELSNAEASPTAVITLKHPGGDAGPVAFKVRSEKDNMYRWIVNQHEEYSINSPCERCSLNRKPLFESRAAVTRICLILVHLIV